MNVDNKNASFGAIILFVKADGLDPALFNYFVVTVLKRTKKGTFNSNKGATGGLVGAGVGQHNSVLPVERDKGVLVAPVVCLLNTDELGVIKHLIDSVQALARHIDIAPEKGSTVPRTKGKTFLKRRVLLREDGKKVKNILQVSLVNVLFNYCSLVVLNEKIVALKKRKNHLLKQVVIA